MIYIVIPVFNRWGYTQTCLCSLRSQIYRAFQTIIVDHGSTDGTSEHIANEFPEVKVLKGDSNMWWTMATNVGVKYALSQPDTTHVLTLNNDLEVNPDYLEVIAHASEKYPNSLVGSPSADRRCPENIVFAGVKWNKWTAKFRPSITLKDFYLIKEKKDVIKTDLLPGRGTLIPVFAFINVGLFNEKQFPHYNADEDFSNRCRKAGFRLIIATSAIVYSEVEATGLSNYRNKKKSLTYWKDLFFSMKSPVNIKRRWYWALHNSPWPPIYFFFDVARIVGSKIKDRI